MPTQKTRRRVKDELVALAGFPPEGIREPFKPDALIWTQRFPMGSGGENHEVSPDALSPDQALLLDGWRPTPYGIRKDFGSQEYGSAKMTPTDILNINLYVEADGTSALIRLDEDDLQYNQGSGWSTISGGMTTSPANGFRSAMVLNTFIWTNGVDEPQAWQVGDASYADLTADSNRPTLARHVVAFADRVVFGDIGASGSTRITNRLEWSASGDPTDFTTLGAGGVTLLDTEDQASNDGIMALKVFNNLLVVLRERSIWIGQRTGEVEAPIRFSVHSQGIGPIASDSVQVCGDLGIIFLGPDNVYLWHPDNREVAPVGTPIRKEIFGPNATNAINMSYLDYTRSAYVDHERHYYLFYPHTTDYPTIGFKLDVGRVQTEQKFVWSRRTYASNVTAAYGGPTTGFGSSYTLSPHQLIIGTKGGETFEYLESLATEEGGTFYATAIFPVFVAERDYLQVKRVNISYTSVGESSLTFGIGFVVDGTDGTLTNYTLAQTDDDRNHPSEDGFWAPLDTYGRSISLIVQASGDSDELTLHSYRVGFLGRGEITGQH